MHKKNAFLIVQNYAYLIIMFNYFSEKVPTFYSSALFEIFFNSQVALA